MLLPTYPIVFRRRRAKARPQGQQPPAMLTLVGASFNGTYIITLTFDRAIDISSFNGPAIILADQPDGLLWQGQHATLVNDSTVNIQLTNIGGAEGDQTLLSATAANGIAAADGGTWAGCSDLVLPFG